MERRQRRDGDQVTKKKRERREREERKDREKREKEKEREWGGEKKRNGEGKQARLYFYNYCGLARIKGN